jgi:ATP-dependent Lon protease
LEEVPDEVKEKMNFVLADRIDQVFAAAILDGKEEE